MEILDLKETLASIINVLGLLIKEWTLPIECKLKISEIVKILVSWLIVYLYVALRVSSE
tara:strand:+ start:506 stop:682 length:177 start_codon:yes stop_codon:yes gene_type:complete